MVIARFELPHRVAARELSGSRSGVPESRDAVLGEFSWIGLSGGAKQPRRMPVFTEVASGTSDRPSPPRVGGTRLCVRPEST
jgi:hypothetical protein